MASDGAVVLNRWKGKAVNLIKVIMSEMSEPWSIRSSQQSKSSEERSAQRGVDFHTAHLEYVERNPVAATTFRIHNRALELNMRGGRTFDAVLGNESMLQVLRMAKSFILREFDMSKEKRVRDVTLFVDDMPGVAHATSKGGHSEIHLSASYVEGAGGRNQAGLLYEITGVLIHESTHIWQNNSANYGNDPVFQGTIEGIADFIRIRARYPARHWRRRCEGTWYSGYETTAYFFDWIDSTLFPGFVNQLNHKMANKWDVRFFEQITGISAIELWENYQVALKSQPSQPR